MNHTFNVSTTQQINENSAIPQGHYLILGHPVSQTEPLWFIDGPAGIISTAEDMAKWMLAQYDGSLLSPELMEQYHTAGQSGPYGMGWLAGEDGQGGRAISHNGIFWTYEAEETIYLDQRLGHHDGAGRVLPWFGLWTSMSSLMIWLVVLSIVNTVNLGCYFKMYCNIKKSSHF
jgi:CubicO group peptidase (beta-lactamase class C family)